MIEAAAGMTWASTGCRTVSSQVMITAAHRERKIHSRLGKDARIPHSGLLHRKEDIKRCCCSLHPLSTRPRRGAPRSLPLHSPRAPLSTSHIFREIKRRRLTNSFSPSLLPFLSPLPFLRRPRELWAGMALRYVVLNLPQLPLFFAIKRREFLKHLGQQFINVTKYGSTPIFTPPHECPCQLLIWLWAVCLIFLV